MASYNLAKKQFFETILRFFFVMQVDETVVEIEGPDAYDTKKTKLDAENFRRNHLFRVKMLRDVRRVLKGKKNVRPS